VSDQGGTVLLQVIRVLRDYLANADHGSLDQRPALGGSHGARAMSPFVQQVACDQQGFLPQLMRLQTVLDDAEHGVQQAMANYRHNEHSVAGSFRR
jgi:hypothetical protein